MNEILFKKYSTNYNNVPDVYKKGSIIYKVILKSLIKILFICLFLSQKSHLIIIK
jgi:tRNA(His) 5'-end guanylyltransferase